jgi:hypothetical protein
MIMFLRVLAGELGDRANGWARDSSNAASSDLKDRFGLTAAVLRELAGAIEAAMKKTLLA